MTDSTHVYELVDVTDEESYYPLGVFLDLNTAVREAEQCDPSNWNGDDRERYARSEIRERALGLSGYDYRVLWRCCWMQEETEPESGEYAWVHHSIEYANGGKALPMCCGSEGAR